MKPTFALIGPPGSGKGTQAKILGAKLGFPLIVVGDIFRKITKEDSQLGRLVFSYLKRGELAPKEALFQVLKNAIGENKEAPGLIFDGTYRRSAEIPFLEQALKEFSFSKPLVIYLDIPDEEVKKRLNLRERADDDPKVIEERLKIYHREVEPILEWLKEEERLIRIDGKPPIPDVALTMEKELKKKKLFL